MRDHIFPTLVTFFLLCAFTITLFGEAAGENSESPVGRVVTVNGFAFIGTRQLKVGDRIFRSDVIETKKNSAVKLLLLDRTVVDVGPVTSFHVNEFKVDSIPEREVDAGVDFGQIRSYVSKKLNEKGRFNIRTRTAVLAVRGTEFFVRHDPTNKINTDRITVSEGRVWVNSVQNASGRQEAILTPGQQWNNSTQSVATAAASSRGSEVVSVSRQEISQIAATNRVKDNTFQAAVTIKSTPENKSASSDSKGSESGRSERSSGDSKSEDRAKSEEPQGTMAVIQETVTGKLQTPDSAMAVVDPSSIAVPGIRESPTDVVKPVSTTDTFDQSIIIKVRVK